MYVKSGNWNILIDGRTGLRAVLVARSVPMEYLSSQNHTVIIKSYYLQRRVLVVAEFYAAYFLPSFPFPKIL